ncbi:MAG: class I SAM-dependent methyltransferase [Bacteroidetes bacterium]|nr:class I SAM-dependent methyltransferase [Bacteroidota bacterium]MBK9046170.1 class I SAM-dependent methyltransferase [Bacteroidota bacterium]
MDFLDERLTEYVEQHTKDESEILAKLNRETQAKVIMPRMLSGHLQGRVLSMLSHMIKPQRILEIGTYTGYSALCLAEGLPENGKLITIDINEELHDMVKRYVKESGYENKIEVLSGDATKIIPLLEEQIDMVFIDADKENYALYYDLTFDKLSTGGYIVADNVLWSGNILKPEDEMDSETLALHQFNKKIQSDNRVENVMFPIRDGLMIIRKK